MQLRSSSLSSPTTTRSVLLGAIGMVLLLILLYRDRCLGGACAAPSAAAAVIEAEDCLPAAALSCAACAECKICPKLPPRSPPAPVNALPRGSADRFAKLTTSLDWERHIYQVLGAADNWRLKKYRVFALARYEQRELALNWITSLQRNKLDNFLLLCLDEKLLQWLNEKGWGEKISLVPGDWMVQGEDDAARIRLRVALQLLQRGYYLTLSEVDSVFLSPHVMDHFNYLLGPGCNANTESQCFGDVSFMYQDGATLTMDMGFFTMRSTEFTRDLLTRALDRERAGQAMEFVWNDLITNTLGATHAKNLRGLDRALYASTYSYFDARVSERMEMQPLLVRAGVSSSKMMSVGQIQERLRGANFWYL